MHKLSHTILFFTIIIIEGYVVLSSELLAIRQTIPFVGSGTDTVSIIIAAVLMPLAFGYQAGGHFRPHRMLGQFITVRKKLIINIVIANAILLPGLSYRFMNVFFPALSQMGLEDRLLQTSIYSILFLVVPVYLLGQTVPLICNFFGRERLSQATGRVLFFSTLGSFLGATFATLALMPTIGVHHTVTLNFALLTMLVIMLGKRKFGWAARSMTAMFLFGLVINSNYAFREIRVVKNNQYSTVTVFSTRNGDNHIMINRNFDSRYNPETGRKHNYIEFVERMTILPLMHEETPREILIIGAGGFTFGHHDRFNNYTFLDIDKDLKEIAEKRILEEPLPPNKTFIPQEARAFLARTKKKYDVIFLDAYLGGVSIPEHLVTQEFFIQVKNALNDDGVLAANFIMSPNFRNVFTRSLDNTFRSIFPHVSRHAMEENYKPWNKDSNALANVIYFYSHHTDYKPGVIYTDDKNTIFYEKPRSF